MINHHQIFMECPECQTRTPKGLHEVSVTRSYIRVKQGYSFAS